MHIKHLFCIFLLGAHSLVASAQNWSCLQNLLELHRDGELPIRGAFQAQIREAFGPERVYLADRLAQVTPGDKISLLVERGNIRFLATSVTFLEVTSRENSLLSLVIRDSEGVKTIDFNDVVSLFPFSFQHINDALLTPYEALFLVRPDDFVFTRKFLESDSEIEGGFFSGRVTAEGRIGYISYAHYEQMSYLGRPLIADELEENPHNIHIIPQHFGFNHAMAEEFARTYFDVTDGILEARIKRQLTDFEKEKAILMAELQFFQRHYAEEFAEDPEERRLLAEYFSEFFFPPLLSFLENMYD